MEEEKLKKDEEKSIDLGKDTLEISKDGFSLWNKEESRYIIDASLWRETRTLVIGDKRFKIFFKKVQELIEIEDEAEK